MTLLRFATHLWFDHDAVAAAELYTGLVPDSHIDRVVAAPPGVPGAEEGAAFFVDLTVGGQRFTFLNGGPQFPFDSQVSMYLLCETQEEVDRYWTGLLAGGGVENACGWLKDRFGLSWQVTPRRVIELLMDPDPARAKRAMDAMLSSVKFDIAAMERAADGR